MSNFSVLGQHDELLLRLGMLAEKYFPDDPNTCLLKLRQLAESMTQLLAAQSGVFVSTEETQHDRLRRLQDAGLLPREICQLFHEIRRTGNAANHALAGDHRVALSTLKLCWQLGLWFHRTFKDPGYKSGPFIPPQAPTDKNAALQAELAKLTEALDAHRSANAQASEKLSVMEAALKEAEDEKAFWESMANEAEAEKHQLSTRLAQQQSAAGTLNRATFSAIKTAASNAASAVQLDEGDTRKLIDSQLRQAGWEVDSVALTYGKGTRPQKGRKLAIAEWPTQSGPADYVLFVGLTPIAVVEAKRENENVAGKIPQAERYSKGFQALEGMNPAWKHEGRSAAWSDAQGQAFEIPFVYSSNSRPYLPQLAEKSGTWFRDVRSAAQLARPLMDFHTPAGLLDMLTRSKAEAEAKLKEEGFAYLQLRNYQELAIQAVESALAAGQTRCLLAMATGTGKTRTIIGLIYRFLKAERFRRILFLVDRTALGDQALDNFNEALLEQNQPLSKIYNIAELGDMAVEAETRVQVATVQAMVKRVFQSDEALGIDDFDCLIVDEAHRGYTLDQEMTEGEMQVRDQSQYLSTYRRVLDYFDAVKIGLTATPARHTAEIFGKPVYTYSYREAVADDWLIDHEPPIRYETLLSQQGIKFDKGETISAINLGTGEIEQSELDDELNFEVESFNRRVINEDFNRVICEQLAQELDPFGEAKTLIFCATDLHADMAKRLLDAAFKDVHGDAYAEAAVRKITGKSDKVADLIKHYKNERYPNIAITVDLLTTGTDVPRIAHLVFLRRVRSRILYEQMVGRATRRCDDIGKTVFKIYDPVDLYKDLQEVSTMKPLVKDPNITLDQLIAELDDPASLAAPGTRMGESHAHDVLDAISQKLMRVLRDATHKAEKKPALKTRLDELEQHWNVPPAQLHQHLQKIGPQAAAEFIRSQAGLLQQIDEVKTLIGSAHMPVLSGHKDELLLREQSYGKYQKPEDYLDSFGRFIREQLNQSVALGVVVNRPRDLTREQLKEVRLLLDQHGYSEARLQTAWRNKTNHEIAASIVGYIRQAALDEALIPFEQRVAQAMQRIYALVSWTPMQRSWLERLAKQLTHEVVIDLQFVNRAFAQDGGAKQLDKRLGGKLDLLMSELAAALWPDAA